MGVVAPGVDPVMQVLGGDFRGHLYQPSPVTSARSGFKYIKRCDSDSNIYINTATIFTSVSDILLTTARC